MEGLNIKIVKVTPELHKKIMEKLKQMHNDSIQFIEFGDDDSPYWSMIKNE
jgi:hypothetical protein